MAKLQHRSRKRRIFFTRYTIFILINRYKFLQRRVGEIKVILFLDISEISWTKDQRRMAKLHRSRKRRIFFTRYKDGLFSLVQDSRLLNTRLNVVSTQNPRLTLFASRGEPARLAASVFPSRLVVVEEGNRMREDLFPVINLRGLARGTLGGQCLTRSTESLCGISRITEKTNRGLSLSLLVSSLSAFLRAFAQFSSRSPPSFFILLDVSLLKRARK